MRFVHDNLPQRVCFGSGEAAAHLGAQIGNLKASKVMVIAGQGERDIAETITKELPVEVAGRARHAAASVNAALAAEGIRSLRAGLPKVVADPFDLDGREQALYLSATSFASAGSGLHQ